MTVCLYTVCLYTRTYSQTLCVHMHTHTVWLYVSIYSVYDCMSLYSVSVQSLYRVYCVYCVYRCTHTHTQSAANKKTGSRQRLNNLRLGTRLFWPFYFEHGRERRRLLGSGWMGCLARAPDIFFSMHSAMGATTITQQWLNGLPRVRTWSSWCLMHTSSTFPMNSDLSLIN